MSRSPHDQAILALLLPQLAIWSTSQQEKRVKYDRQGRVSQLRLIGLDLTKLPPEVSQFSQLRWLYLGNNQLTSVPEELGQLSQLRYLDLTDNPNLHHPPPNVVADGTEAILTSLRTHQRGRTM